MSFTKLNRWLDRNFRVYPITTGARRKKLGPEVEVLEPRLAPAIDWFPFGGHEYARTDVPMTFDQAEAYAVSLGGHLVSITSAAEQNFITTNFGSPAWGYDSTSIWIGLTDRVNEGTYLWTSGESLTYSNWHPGEPNNNYGGNEDYVVVNYVSPGTWVDVEPNVTSAPTCPALMERIATSPRLTVNVLDIRQGGTAVLSSTNLNAVNPDNPVALLTFTVSDVTHGNFEVGGATVNNFTMADVNAGSVSFMHDGSEIAPAYKVKVGDGVTETTPASALITFHARYQIAFNSNREGNNEIYVMNPDGTSQTRLTNNPAEDWDPAISPDGTKVVFNSTRDGDWETYVMNIDGSGVTQLTFNNGYADGLAVFSPDGSQIAFDSNREGGRYEIYVMNVDGTNQVRLTSLSADNRNPSWSPDGNKIVFESTRDGGDWELYVMDANGSNQTRITSSPGYDNWPSWSPYGDKIAFCSSRAAGDLEIYVMNVDGSNVVRLTNAPGARDDVPNWSPDGTQIVFVSNRAGGNYDIYTMNADGSNVTCLTTTSSFDARPFWGGDVNVAPLANAGGPYTIVEGQDLVLNGSGSDLDAGDSIVSYAWDLDNDGVFDDATGATPTISWNTLKTLSLGDDRATPYPIALQVTDTQGTPGTATTSLTVINKPPVLTLSGASSVNEGAVYTLNLSAIDPGNDTIDYWTINWGDGTPVETVIGNPPTKTHVYADGPRNTTILATATDEDGTWQAVATGSNAQVAIDPTFGSNGEIRTDFYGTTADYGRALLLLPDGKVLVAGQAQGGDSNIVLVQYLANGSLDSAFGTEGTVVTDFGTSETVSAAVRDSQGRILVAGSFGLARYMPNGTLDFSFGNNGRMSLMTGIQALTLDSQQRIVAVTSNSLRRFNPDGSTDLTFNGGNVVSLSFIGTIQSVAVDSLDRVLVGGYYWNGTNQDSRVARYTTTGSLDTSSFGVTDGDGLAGMVTIDFGGRNETSTYVVPHQDGIVVAGRTDPLWDSINRVYYDPSGNNRLTGDIAQVRLNSDGTLDTTGFGLGGPEGDGKVQTDFGSWDYVSSLAITPTGQILVGEDGYWSRYEANGTLETSIGSSGRVYSNVSTVYGLGTDLNGNILTAGYRSVGNDGNNLAIARYLPGGTLDPTFAPGGSDGVNGLATTGFQGSTSDYVQNLTVTQLDGKVLVAGYKSGGVTELVLARYLTDGTPDATFGSGGILIDTTMGSPTALTFDHDGNIVVASQYYMARYTANGVPDNSFGRTTDHSVYTVGTLYITDLVLDTAGKIVVGGYRTQWNPDGSYYSYPLTFARYYAISNPVLGIVAGDLDTSFGVNGSTTIDLGSSASVYTYSQVEKMSIDAAGRIVSAGFSYASNRSTGSTIRNNDFIMARLMPNGTLDPSFGTGGLDGIDGVVLTDFGGGEYAYGLALDNLGRIVVGGTGNVVRYLEDGSLDSTFSGDGKQATGFDVRAVVIDAANRVIAGGGTRLTRYLENGNPDTQFAPGGTLNIPSRSIYDLALDPAGRIVLGGSVYTGGATGSDFYVSRYLKGGLVINVLNVSPQNVTITALDSGPEGTALSLSGSATDPAGIADPLTYSWSITRNNEPFMQASGADISFLPTDNGTYRATLTVTDGDGGSTSLTKTISVTNVAPTAVLSAPNAVAEGGSFTLSLTDAADVSTADTAAGFEYAFNPGTGYGAWSSINTASFTASVSGPRTVYGRIRDRDGGVREYSTTLIVNNVAPTVEAGVNRLVDEGTLVTFSGSFTDPGTLETYTTFWDFGDGSTAEGTLTPSHTYADNGLYTVRLKVRDSNMEPGTWVEDTLTVTVVNVTPQLSDLTVTSSINEGSTATLTGTYSDPGNLDSHTLDIAWGDGTTSTSRFALGSISTLEVGLTFASSTDSAILTVTLVDLAAHSVGFRVDHCYLDNQPSEAEYTITVTVTDNDDDFSTSTVQIAVSNVAPVVHVNPVTPINEGEIATLTGTFTDPGLLDTHTVVIDWGGGRPGRPDEGTTTLTTTGENPVGTSLTYLGGGVWGFSATHQYLDDNPTGTPVDCYTLSATVTDKDGGIGQAGIDDANSGSAVFDFNGSMDLHNYQGYDFAGFWGIWDKGDGDYTAAQLAWWWNSETGNANGIIRRLDGGDFPLQSFRVRTDRWYNLPLWVEGYKDGVLVASKSLNLSPAYQTATFGSEWSILDEVRFFMDSGYGAYIYIDNVRLTGSSDLLVRNIAPTVINHNLSVNEDGPPVTLDNVLTGLTDQGVLDTHTAIAGTFSSAWGAQVTIAANGMAIYDPGNVFRSLGADETGWDYFNYIAQDDDGGMATGTVIVTVIGQNDPPVAVADLHSSVLDFNGSPDIHNYQGYDFIYFGLSTSGFGDGDDTSASSYMFDIIRRVDGSEFALQSLRIRSGWTDCTMMVNGYREGVLVASQTLNLTPTYQTAPFGSEWNAIDEIRFDLGGVEEAFMLDNVHLARLGLVTDEDHAINIHVLPNDYDSDVGDTISFTAHDATSANGATIALNSDGTIHYDPTGSAALQALQIGTSMEDTFQYTITDTHGEIDTATVTVLVKGVNDKPTVTEGANYSMTSTDENTPSASSLVSEILTEVGYADVDVPANDRGIAVIETTGIGNWQYLDGIEWKKFGEVNDASSLLLGKDVAIRYLPNGLNGETATITFRGWDRTSGLALEKVNTIGNGGNTAFSAETAGVSIAVSPVNDAPTITAGNTFVLATTNEDTYSTATAVSSILVGVEYADVDLPANNAGIAVIATDGNGIWQYRNGADWVDFGTVSEMESLLLSQGREVRYLPDGLNGETATITFHAWDSTTGTDGEKVTIASVGGSAAFSTETATASLEVTPVNDAPTVNGTGSSSISDKETVIPFSGVVIGDVDSPAQSLVVTVRLDNAAKGVLTNLGEFIDNHDGSYGYTGTADLATAAIQALIYDPTENRVAPDLTETTTFTIEVNDGVVLAPTTNSTTTVTVRSMNDAPVNFVPGTQTITRNGSRVFSIANGNAIGATDVDAGDNPVEVLLTVTSGTLTVASTVGVTILNNGSSGVTLTGNLSNVNTALNGLTFQSTFGFTGQVTLSVTTTDKSPNPMDLQDVDAFFINVENTKPPTNPSGLPGVFAYSCYLNQSLSVPVSTGVVRGATDSDGDPLTAVLYSGPTSGSLTLNPDGSFVYTPPVGFMGSVQFKFRYFDGLEYSDPVTVTINVKGPPNQGRRR